MEVRESTLDVGEQTVGETTGYQTEVSRYSRPICKLESSFLSSTKTSQNIYIWITVSHPAVTWALRHVKLFNKNKRLNKRDVNGKTDDRKVFMSAD